MTLDGKAPSGPIERQWDRRREELRLVSPANKRKYRVIVVGTGLAGASAAASLGELGYQVEAFCFQDSPRRAHSIAAQGGINAAKNYPNDGDSVLRLFRDTVKGGDFRSREANVYRLAQVSNGIIDQAVAQGVPFARDYAGLPRQPLLRRRAGLAHLLRPRPDRPAAAARRLSGHDAPGRRRHRAAAPAHRDARPGRRRRRGPRHHRARPGLREDRVARRRRRLSCDRRLRERLLPLDERAGLQRHRRVAGLQARRALRQPLLHADPPDVHPGHRRAPVQADADVRVAAQRRAGLGARSAPATPARRGRSRRRTATTCSSASTRATATSPRATSPRARPRRSATRGAASAPAAAASTSTSPTRSGGSAPRRSGGATATSSRCTSASPARTPTRCRCASTRRRTTRWAGSGSTTTSRARSPGSSCSARPTSPTTAQTGSAPAP